MLLLGRKAPPGHGHMSEAFAAKVAFTLLASVVVVLQSSPRL